LRIQQYHQIRSGIYLPEFDIYTAGSKVFTAGKGNRPPCNLRVIALIATHQCNNQVLDCCVTEIMYSRRQGNLAVSAFRHCYITLGNGRIGEDGRADMRFGQSKLNSKFPLSRHINPINIGPVTYDK